MHLFKMLNHSNLLSSCCLVCSYAYAYTEALVHGRRTTYFTYVYLLSITHYFHFNKRKNKKKTQNAKKKSMKKKWKQRIKENKWLI